MVQSGQGGERYLGPQIYRVINVQRIKIVIIIKEKTHQQQEPRQRKHVVVLPVERRRRECITCGHRFTTHEVVFVDTEIKKPMVKIRRKSKSKSYEPVRSRKTDSFVVQHDDDTQEFIEGYLKGKL